MFPHPRHTGPLTTYIATRVGSHSHDFQLPGVWATERKWQAHIQQ
jgi:hypothetical protein